MSNPRKNMVLKAVWLKNKEFKELITAIENQDKETIGNIIIDIYLRNDIQND